jgi:hypothetical protein
MKTNMKTAAIALMVIGLLMAVYPGFTYVTRDNVAHVGDLQLTTNNNHTIGWQPYVGVGVMVIGGFMLVMSRKKPLLA